MLQHVNPLDAILCLGGSHYFTLLVEAVIWAVVVFVEALRQMTQCLAIFHIGHTALLMMLAVELQALQMACSKFIQLADSVLAGQRVILTMRTHLLPANLHAVGAENLAALAADLRTTDDQLACLASQELYVLLVDVEEFRVAFDAFGNLHLAGVKLGRLLRALDQELKIQLLELLLCHFQDAIFFVLLEGRWLCLQGGELSDLIRLTPNLISLFIGY